MTGLVDGVRVVDLSWGMSGPISAMLLADNGADVIKVEPPGGDPFRFYKPYHVWNRGKRSITADLKSATGKDILLDLLATADVMIESFQPGEMEKLGLGHKELGQRFPRLVHVTITGYGPDDPRSQEPGYEALITAWLGLQSEQPGKRPGPRYVSFPIASYGAAFMATIGALAGLRARSITGCGQHVDTSLVDGAVALSNMSWFWSEKHCDKSKSKPLDGKLRMRHLMLLGALQCGDGKYIQFHTGPAGRFQRALDLLGIGDKVTYAEPNKEKATPLTPEETTFLETNIPRVLKTKPRDHWIKAFEEAA